MLLASIVWPFSMHPFRGGTPFLLLTETLPTVGRSLHFFGFSISYGRRQVGGEKGEKRDGGGRRGNRREREKRGGERDLRREEGERKGEEKETCGGRKEGEGEEGRGGGRGAVGLDGERVGHSARILANTDVLQAKMPQNSSPVR